jgi:hypothetical protein
MLDWDENVDDDIDITAVMKEYDVIDWPDEWPLGDEDVLVDEDEDDDSEYD